MSTTRTAAPPSRPAPPTSFDVVVSSLAISNIWDAGGRAHARREAVRVLRPGGRLRRLDLAVLDG